MQKVKATETQMWGVFYWSVDRQRWERSDYVNTFRLSKNEAERDAEAAQASHPALVYQVLPVKVIAEPVPPPAP